jgi:hypothetical protein
MASYLDNLTEYTSKAQVKIAELAVEAATIIAGNGNPWEQINNINWWTCLLKGANDISQNETLRLNLLTLLVDNARLNPMPIANVFGLYQSLNGTNVTATEWGLITGDINNQNDLIAKFNTYLPLAGGTMTGNILVVDGFGIDSSDTGYTLNIGASNTALLNLGVAADIYAGTFVQGVWNATEIAYNYGGTGITDLTGQAAKALVVNGTEDGYEFATIPSVAGYVKADGSVDMTGSLLFDPNLGIDLNAAGTLFIGGTATDVEVASDLKVGLITQGDWNGTEVALAYGGTGESLSDPGAHSFMFWDNTTNAVRFTQLQSSLTFDSGTNRVGVSPSLTGITLGAGSTWNGNAIGYAYGGTGLTALGTGLQYLRTNAGATAMEWATLTALTNPMTTLGDIIYEDATPEPARLAGNTTTTRKFLSQTGNGTISAAPAWNALSTSDLPIVPLSKGGLGIAFSDPNANRLLGWDDATSEVSWIVLGSGLSYDAGTKTLAVSATGIVASVTGTANEIDVDNTDPSNPIISMSATYAGNANITTLGTIGSGTWQAALIDGVYGGTGIDVTTLTPGDSIRVNITGTAWEPYTPSGGGGGDVNGPGPTVVNGNFAVYNGTGGYTIGEAANASLDTAGNASFTSVRVAGTGGNGHIHMRHQASAVSGTASTNTIYALASGSNGFGFIINNAAYASSLVFGATVARTYTLPDASGTFTLLGNTTTGSGDIVLATSPTLTTSLLTGSTTFALLNTTATTINFGGAATTLNMAGGSGAVINLGGGVNAAELRFLEPSGSGTNYTGFKAQAQAGNVTYTLPAADGTTGQVLQTNGSGVLSWATAAGGSTPLSGITASTADNNIPNGNFTNTWNFNSNTTKTAFLWASTSLTTGSMLQISQTTASWIGSGSTGLVNIVGTTVSQGAALSLNLIGNTVAASNAQRGLWIQLSGTNATSAQTTYGADISNTHGGTTSTNIGVRVTVNTGATANVGYAFVGSGTGIAEGIAMAHTTGATAGNGNGIYWYYQQLWGSAGGSRVGSITHSNTAIGVYDFIFSTYSGTLGEAMRIGGSNRSVGINTGATISAKLHVTAITEQLRLGYDSTNYLSVTVGATSATTIALSAAAQRITLSNAVTLPAGTTSNAPIRFLSGVAPTSPTDGDMWYDGTDVKFRVGGTTKTFTLT